MIVWIASFPRSGNRLCRTTLRHAFGQKTGVATSAPSLRNTQGKLLKRMAVAANADPLPALRGYGRPIFLKTHRLPMQLHWLPRSATRPDSKQKRRTVPPEDYEDSPAIYLVRDGRACLVSYSHYLKDVHKEPRFQTMSHDEGVAYLMRRRGHYGGWSGHVRAWRERPGPTAIVRFEDLIDDPIAALAAGTKEVGVELPKPRRQAFTFEEMKSRSSNPKIIRRGRADSWRSEFPKELLEEFWELHGEEMQALDYPRE